MLGFLRLVIIAVVALPSLGAQQTKTPIPIAAAIATRGTEDTVTIAGRATSATGQLQTTSFDVAVQDPSGGIRVFSRKLKASVKEGDSVVASGVVNSYRGDIELMAGEITVVPGDRRVIQPVELPIDKEMMGRFSGQLIRVSGRVAGFGLSEGGQWLRLRDVRPEANGTITVWVPSNHGAHVDLSQVRYEDRLTVTGVVTAFQDNADDPIVWQLVPRDRYDVIVAGAGARIPAWILWTALGLALIAGAGLMAGRMSARRQIRALKETETRYQQLLALSPDAVIVHARGAILFANPAAEHLLASVGKPIPGRPIHDFVHPEFRDAIDQPPEVEPGKLAPRKRGQFLTTDGGIVEVEVTASPCVYLDQPAIVILARDIAAQLRYERDLRALALVDELTGLQNRRGFTLFAEQERARARRDKRNPVVLFADVDRLKSINDQYGHAQGDEAIKIVANAFKSITRETDIVARWAGDEFVALLGEGGEQAADQISDRLRTAIRALTPRGTPYTVSVSVGTCVLDPELPLSEAMERADAELLLLKKR